MMTSLLCAVGALLSVATLTWPRPAAAATSPGGNRRVDLRPSSAELCRRAIVVGGDSSSSAADRLMWAEQVEVHCGQVQVVPESKAAALRWRRRRREIYLPDERIQVVDKLYRRHPFASVVKISTGCTGGLLTPHHVITAAHCLHIDGSYAGGLRAGQPETLAEVRSKFGRSLHDAADHLRSYHWHTAGTAQVPDAWVRDTDERPASDYGLVTLQPQDCLVTSYLKLQPMSVARLRDLVRLGSYVLHLTSFADDQLPATLWYRHCGVEHVDDDGMIFFDCDTIFGSSGAAVYVYIVVGYDHVQRKQILRRRIIGINSGNRNFRDSRGRARRLNVATGITPDRYREICRWAPEMCEVPDYRDRNETDSRLMRCGPLTTRRPRPPPTVVTTTAAPQPDDGDATTGTLPRTRSRLSALSGGSSPPTTTTTTAATTADATLENEQDDGSTAEPATPPTATEAITTPEETPAPTTVATTTASSRIDRFLRLCAGLGRSLQAECLRWARRTAQAG